MREALLLLLQAAAGTPPERIDLTRPLATDGCAVPTGDDILVCGGKTERYRIGRPDTRFETRSVPKAEIGLLGGRAAVETEAVQMPGGVQSNRLMVRLRLPF